MSSLPKSRYSVDDYLALDRAADCKSEYVAGDIFAMGGASPRYVLIAGNVVGKLCNRLRDTNCQVYLADLRIQAGAGNTYYYPDVAVVWGEPEYFDGKENTITNPLIVVEVFSPTTQNYDRGDKLRRAGKRLYHSPARDSRYWWATQKDACPPYNNILLYLCLF
jgi:Uma2 family endonuclease